MSINQIKYLKKNKKKENNNFYHSNYVASFIYINMGITK